MQPDPPSLRWRQRGLGPCTAVEAVGEATGVTPLPHSHDLGCTLVQIRPARGLRPLSRLGVESREHGGGGSGRGARSARTRRWECCCRWRRGTG